jgi:hypothetical protein
MTTQSKSLANILNESDSRLSAIMKRASLLRQLTHYLQQSVDAPMNEHLYVANIRGNTLVIGTESAAWLARVRYLGPMILGHMRQKPGLEKLTQIEFKVQPFLAEFHPSETARPTLSENTSHILHQAAKEVSDPALKSALLRLSKRNAEES